MAVFRVERTNNYTVMSNYHLRDKTLSLKAKGLLSLMLSLPETWDYTLSGLARISLEGKDAIRAAWWSWKRRGISSAARPPIRPESSAATSTSFGSIPLPRRRRWKNRRRKTRQRKNRRRVPRRRETRRRFFQHK